MDVFFLQQCEKIEITGTWRLKKSQILLRSRKKHSQDLLGIATLPSTQLSLQAKENEKRFGRPEENQT
ncbi:Hypp9733 [Branchiostoma lanceolatum]|uniref:Hypp9733 protein n=1 Tax=Branchiostoma lanceolatum TaxID=7740 RepID=A0A8S4MPM2_BRALA|nr:Hypp9733 [Branchiostoma lanceolatum]